MRPDAGYRVPLRDRMAADSYPRQSAPKPLARPRGMTQATTKSAQHGGQLPVSEGSGRSSITGRLLSALPSFKVIEYIDAAIPCRSVVLRWITYPEVDTSAGQLSAE